MEDIFPVANMGFTTIRVHIPLINQQHNDQKDYYKSQKV